MEIDFHVDKAQRLENSRTNKLNAYDDYELVIWSITHGSAHLVNAALHHMKATDATKDYIHAFKVEADSGLPEKALHLMRLLSHIEIYSPRYVRGPEVPSKAEFQACVDEYDALKKEVMEILNS